MVLSEDAASLLTILTAGGPDRHLYRAQSNGGWFLSRWGGQFSDEAISELVSAGLVSSVYSNCPDEAYHVGRTIDVVRSMYAREKLGKKAGLIYTDEPAITILTTETS